MYETCANTQILFSNLLSNDLKTFLNIKYLKKIKIINKNYLLALLEKLPYVQNETTSNHQNSVLATLLISKTKMWIGYHGVRDV